MWPEFRLFIPEDADWLVERHGVRYARDEGGDDSFPVLVREIVGGGWPGTMPSASAAGYRRMRLWTHESHRAAGRLYARNGFRLDSAQACRSFGQQVVSQIWVREL
ncbi:MAG: hypothetical protein ACK4S2_07810 [Gemmobacter sp.]|uniref:hypothetical protein n=1 Tax=Gemmobacter sp. TaxID=1898957 RepID=UPI00391C0BA3